MFVCLYNFMYLYIVCTLSIARMNICIIFVCTLVYLDFFINTIVWSSKQKLFASYFVSKINTIS